MGVHFQNGDIRIVGMLITAASAYIATRRPKTPR